MAKLIYSAIASLDGYVADEGGAFGWAAPDEEVHAFVNDLERDIGTYLYGRRMYEVMAFWETAGTESQTPAMRDFAAIWQAADKVIYSRTLTAAPTARTRIERDLDPETVRNMKADQQRDISIGGPCLAAEALRAGLVDECQLILVPVVVGAGTACLPGGCASSSSSWTSAALRAGSSISVTESDLPQRAPRRRVHRRELSQPQVRVLGRDRLHVPQPQRPDLRVRGASSSTRARRSGGTVSR